MLSLHPQTGALPPFPSSSHAQLRLCIPYIPHPNHPFVHRSEDELRPQNRSKRISIVLKICHKVLRWAAEKRALQTPLLLETEHSCGGIEASTHPF